MVKLFASAFYTATALLTAVHACVWESSGDVVGNLTLYCADVATGARLEPTSTTAPMVSVDARDALQVVVRADATQEILNADASDWTTAYNATVAAPASGGYSVVLVCGKPDGGACHVSYGLQWASPVPVRRALATETGCYFSGSYTTGFTDPNLVFTCNNVQPGFLVSIVSSSSDKFFTAFFDASNYARYKSGGTGTCLNTGCATIYSAESTTSAVVVTSSGSYTLVIRCQNSMSRCTVNADIYFHTKAPAVYMGCSFSGNFAADFAYIFVCDSVQPGVFTPTVSSASDSFSVTIFDGANYARYISDEDGYCANADCLDIYTAQSYTKSLNIGRSGTYAVVVECHNSDGDCNFSGTINFNTGAALTPTPGATTPSGASSTCPVPGTYLSTDMRLELSSSGTFAQTNDGGNGVTCATTGAYEVSGQKASFTVSTVSAECRSRYTINQKYSVPFSFSSSCQQLTLIDATKTWTLQRVSSAPMASVTMLLAVLLAWCAL
ncbi:hypothetical protein SPRG_22309 [Saprolegnia parasitica CBS 223.65]|uniref:Uncharacterized protein n=1 Tax=Saprolegnia parasitica (strain CBS 223.65) TaxID=695850 RepID=A0A067BUY0_SAPPC|nr:hypothetical protein SPRG_22309 [Saprolegnia parasitica CBS 223.65]KDO22319.1 hypothetical protein SPRG_22309 [Saprolegnia parasitica CBS 223.65]|eukprot:XP_012206986.1 hypothetical protein SPRG_22309 [Saprolegnia parasitica CBS 223.65]